MPPSLSTVRDDLHAAAGIRRGLVPIACRALQRMAELPATPLTLCKVDLDLGAPAAFLSPSLSVKLLIRRFNESTKFWVLENVKGESRRGPTHIVQLSRNNFILSRL